MSTDLMIGMGIGLAIIIVVFVIRSMLKPKEIEMNVYPEAEALSSVDTRDFRMLVEDVFMIKGRGAVVTGKIERGAIQRGQRVRLSAMNGNGSLETRVREIESFRKKQDSAQAGDNVGLLLSDLSKDEIQKGMVITIID